MSQHYTASHWCMFEAHMSQHRLVEVFKFIRNGQRLFYREGIIWIFPQDNRQSLVLVKLEELEARRMTKEMKYLVSSLTYLAWPQKGKIE